MTCTPYELRRDLRDDRVAVGAQASHSAGYPMSQRECAGFNRPRFSVGAGEPFASPTVSAKSGRVEPCRVSPIARFSCPPRSVSCSVGVGQLANATVLLELSLLPASL